MAEPSSSGSAASFRKSGIAPERARNPLRERLQDAKREAVESALGKGESWCTKLLAGESGVRLDDLPALLAFLGLKIVSGHKVCVDPEIAHAYEVIVARATQARQLLEEDAE